MKKVFETYYEISQPIKRTFWQKVFRKKQQFKSESIPGRLILETSTIEYVEEFIDGRTGKKYSDQCVIYSKEAGQRIVNGSLDDIHQTLLIKSGIGYGVI